MQQVEADGFSFFNLLLACRIYLWRGHGPSRPYWRNASYLWRQIQKRSCKSRKKRNVDHTYVKWLGVIFDYSRLRHALEITHREGKEGLAGPERSGVIPKGYVSGGLEEGLWGYSKIHCDMGGRGWGGEDGGIRESLVGFNTRL